MFKVNNKDNGTTLQVEHSVIIVNGYYHKVLHLERRSGVFIVNFEHILHLVLVYLLLTLNM